MSVVPNRPWKTWWGDIMMPNNQFLGTAPRVTGVYIMGKPILHTTVPILASLDIATTVRFYTEKLGFSCGFQSLGEYAILHGDDIEIHFWPCGDVNIAENTACRIGVTNIAVLYEECSAREVLRPDCKLHDTSWGTREFEVFDPHGNLITFFERNTPVA